MDDTSIISYQKRSPQLDPSVFVASGTRIIGDVRALEHSSFWFNVTVRADVHFVSIGSRTNIQDNTVIHVTHQKFPTLIGNGVTIGHSAIIHACEIEDECLIGMGACILDGAKIAKHSFLAAGSLVSPNKSYPEGSFLMGRPAKVVRKLTAQEISEKIIASSSHYINIKNNYEEDLSSSL